eukprot:scaffold44361_cov57-Phaeocystis_antarctica.AAC.4
MTSVSTYQAKHAVAVHWGTFPLTTNPNPNPLPGQARGGGALGYFPPHKRAATRAAEAPAGGGGGGGSGGGRVCRHGARGGALLPVP